MTQLLDSYVSDIEKSFSIVKTSLSTHKQSPLSKKQSTLPSLKVELYEIEKLIKLMETEIVSFSGKQKNASAQKVKSYKLQYENLRKKVSLFDEEIRNERNNSKQSSTPTTTSHSLEMNERSSKSKGSKYSKLQDSRSDEEDVNFKLKQSVKVMYEIGDMSDNISHELSNQTARLQDSNSKLGKIRVEILKGEKKIKKIMIRLRRNQFVFYMVILMLVLMASFILTKVFA